MRMKMMVMKKARCIGMSVVMKILSFSKNSLSFL